MHGCILSNDLTTTVSNLAIKKMKNRISISICNTLRKDFTRKYALVVIFLISSISLFGQTDSVKYSEQYFEFKAVPRGLFTKGTYYISISLGEKYLSKDSAVRAKYAKNIEYFSEVEDVLEYLNQLGWTLVSAYATSHDHFYVRYYIMKRTI